MLEQWCKAALLGDRALYVNESMMRSTRFDLNVATEAVSGAVPQLPASAEVQRGAQMLGFRRWLYFVGVLDGEIKPA